MREKNHFNLSKRAFFNLLLCDLIIFPTNFKCGGLRQLEMGTNNVSLNWPNLSVFSAIHTLMDRYFSQTCLAALGELGIKFQSKKLIIISCSVAFGTGPSSLCGPKATLFSS